MLASIEWLKSLLPDLDADVETVAARLTAAGLEVEGLTRLAEALDGVVVAEVRAVKPHPKADKLRLASVFDGRTEQTVVCGAPNVAEGQKAAFAPLGVTLPNGLTMERRAIRGVQSEGMLCAEDELGLSDDHEGIIVLSSTASVGAPVAEALGLRDVILELGITPNRPDALSHVGLARELAALQGIALADLSVPLVEAGEPAATMAAVHIDDPEGCARYSGRVLTGVVVGPSPRWVQDRLRALGQRPISNVVDATNLTLLELGQPLHAFDLDRLDQATIRVRRAAPGERMTLLDGSEHELHEDDLIIADAKVPVALAGVMGGLDSEVTAGGGEGGRVPTTRVLLESAWFDPSRVRKSARRHGLHTEASHRFERGADLGMVEQALDRCAQYIAEWAQATVHPGRIVVEGQPRERPPIPIRAERAALLLGRPVDDAQVVDALERLGLEPVDAPTSEPRGARWYRAPSWRVDLAIEVDLIEEVGRLAGYDAVPAVMPPGSREPWHAAPSRDVEDEVRQCLVGEGFLESISLAFASPAKAAPFLCPDRPPVRVANPLGEESRLMRPSLLPALLEAARHNQDQLPSITDLRLFEIGRAFTWGPAEQLPEEEHSMACVLRGRRLPRSWGSDPTLVDVYDLKGVLEAILEAFRLKPRFRATEDPVLHPRSATLLVDGDVPLGRFGEIHPDIAELFGLEGPPVLVAELSLDRLAERRGAEPRHRSLPKLPPAQRDLSFFVEVTRDAEEALDVVRAAAPSELESLRIFDVYEGPGVPEGMKSLALELVFRSAERTLADADIDAAQKTIVDALSEQLGARIRDG